MQAAQHSFYDSVTTAQLPERVVELSAEYDRLIGVRDDFVWRWIYSLLPSFRLTCVADSYQPVVREQKTILTLFITLLDDVAEHDGDKATFEQARNVPFPHQTVDTSRSDVDTDTVKLAERLWTAFEEPLHDAPRGPEFLDVLRYDVRQALNAMDYTWLVGNNPSAANLAESYRYGTHNMIMYPYANVDLMHAPEFDRADLAVLRETLGELQRLARIGNWMTTWEREIEEGDYSSGVVVAALETGLFDPAELPETPSEAEAKRYVEAIADHGLESRFNSEWHERFEKLRAETPDAESVDLDALVEGMLTVFEYHQESRGMK